MKKLLPLLITLLFNPFLIAENDPFEEINRTTLKVNKKLDKVIATPVAKFYQKLTPDFIEVGYFKDLLYLYPFPVDCRTCAESLLDESLCGNWP